ncbi:MAG: response regulator transcription factor [Colwellia sp.]
MIKLRTIIAEDEHYLRQELANRLKAHPRIELICECKNGVEAVEAITRLTPDLVFLDIMMPGLNGFDVIHAIQSDIMPEVIFATAFDHYAIKAFDVQAIDYLVKPYSHLRLNQSVNNVISRKGTHNNNKSKQNLVDISARLSNTEIHPPSFDKTKSWYNELIIESKTPAIIIKTIDIAWVDAAGDYMCVHANNETYIMRCTMKKLINMLDPSIFLRIHRSTIINLHHVKKMVPLQKGDYQIDLNDVTRVRLSRSYNDSRRSITAHMKNRISFN